MEQTRTMWRTTQPTSRGACKSPTSGKVINRSQPARVSDNFRLWHTPPPPASRVVPLPIGDGEDELFAAPDATRNVRYWSKADAVEANSTNHFSPTQSRSGRND